MGDRVLVIPGLDGDPTMVQAAAPRLFRGMRVLPFDHRLDTMDDGVEGLAERALAVLDSDRTRTRLPLYAANRLAERLPSRFSHRHPTRVRGLILLSAFGWYPSVFGCLPRLHLGLWRVLGDAWARSLLRLWRPLSLPAALGWGCSPEVMRAYVRRPALDLAGYRAKCEMALRFDARPWLDAITCPTLILIGTWDPLVPTRAGQELARRMPNAGSNNSRVVT